MAGMAGWPGRREDGKNFTEPGRTVPVRPIKKGTRMTRVQRILRTCMRERRVGREGGKTGRREKILGAWSDGPSPTNELYPLHPFNPCSIIPAAQAAIITHHNNHDYLRSPFQSPAGRSWFDQSTLSIPSVQSVSYVFYSPCCASSHHNPS